MLIWAALARAPRAVAVLVVAPRTGASSDDKMVAGTGKRFATPAGITEVIGEVLRNSCRCMATRCR